MYGYEEKSSKTRIVAKAGAAAVGVALAIGLVRGCNKVTTERTIDGYRSTEDTITGIVSVNYPDYRETGIPLTKPATLREAAARIDKVLSCYSAVLRVEHPFHKRYPFIIDSEHALQVGEKYSEWHQNDAWVLELAEFKSAKALCLNLREQMSAELDICREVLKENQAGSDNHDQQTKLYVTSLIPRLQILSERLRGGHLMSTGNILNWTNKFGTFGTMIGQTEHFDEARAETKALLEYLALKGVTR